MGLLLAGYLGSFLVGERAVRGVGLPSGVEWVAIGFILGPYLLDVVGQGFLETVEPILIIGIGWLALGIGLDYGYSRGRPVKAIRFVGGILWGLAVGSPIGAAVYFILPAIWPALAHDRLPLAIGIGAVSIETTRHVMDWVAERHSAQGPLFDLICDMADTEDIVPVLAVAVMFALRGNDLHARWFQGTGLEPFLAKAGVTLALGIVLGALTAWLLGRELRVRESWGVLIGCSMIAIGIAARAGLSVVTVLFVLGAALGIFAHHAKDIRQMVAGTERSALVPTMVMAGAKLQLLDPSRAAYVIGVALAARLIAKYVLGGLVGFTFKVARPAGGLFGVGMLSSGALSMCIGLSISLRYPGPIGNMVLAAATAMCVTGEIFGPPALRTALKRAGEIPESNVIVATGSSPTGAAHIESEGA